MNIASVRNHVSKKLSCAKNPFVYISFRSVSSTVFYQPPKSKDFYESEAKFRRYFYLIDSRGQLFLEENKHRNYATCLKDKKFLDFFYRQLRLNHTDLYKEKPFISPCGKELNYITVDDQIAPLVFTDLVQHNNDPLITNEYTVTIGNSSLKQPFRVQSLSISTSTGRMYHSIDGLRHLGPAGAFRGLLHPSVADTLSNYLTIDPDTNKHTLRWNGEEFEIPQI